MTRKTPDLSVYLVTDAALAGDRGVLRTVREALRGGVTTVQLRDKAASDAAVAAMARHIKAMTDDAGAALLVNDRLAVANAVGADGLHVGQEDGDVAAIRAALRADAFLGLSVETPAQARAVDPAVVDYVGAGPVFATATKPDHAAPTGLDGLAEIRRLSPVPVVAIGGLSLAHVAGVMAVGAAGVAVVSAICAAVDAEAAARDLRTAVDAARAT